MIAQAASTPVQTGFDLETTAVWVTGIIAATIAIWGVISQRALTRRRATMDLIFGILNDHDYIKARKRFISLSKQTGGLLQYAQIDPPKIDDEPDEDGKSSIDLILNNYELLAIGIQRGILDFRIIKLYMRAIVLAHWKVAASYVTELREVRENQRYYVEFETLKNWMDDNNPQKPNGRFWALWF